MSILLKCTDITINIKHIIIGYSNKANNDTKNMLCVVGNIGLMDHVVLC